VRYGFHRKNKDICANNTDVITLRILIYRRIIQKRKTRGFAMKKSVLEKETVQLIKRKT
jgi:hypothetical protein